MRRAASTHLCLALTVLVAAALWLPALPGATAAEPLTARWRPAGLAGHQVNAIAVAPDDGRLLYAGTGTGQDPDTQRIYRSSDGAGAWEAVYTEPQGDHDAVAIDPSNSAVVYVGEAYEVLKTVNGGRSWEPLPSIGAAGHTAIAIDPSRPATVYVGMEFGWGVFKSTNGGAAWSNPLSSVYVTALALDPQSPATLFAGSRDYISGPTFITAGGVHRSRDGGASWTKVLTNSAVLSLLVDPRDPRVLYAGTEGDGVLKSVDGGDTWLGASAGLAHPVVRALAMSPLSSQVLYAGTWEGGVYRSRDGGASWAPLNEGLGNLYVLALAPDPLDPTVLYAGTRGDGVYKFSGPPQPGPDELYARVVDESGEPVAGAQIFHNGRELRDELGRPRLTDAAGNLVLSGASPGDTLAAALLLHEEPTARAGHAGWAYRAYRTSLVVGADGSVGGARVAGATGPQTLTLRAGSPLILFNMVVSVEWDAERAYLDELGTGLARASDMLFDMSDGQMAFGQVTIFDRATAWGDADIQVATANVVRPHAFVGGIASADKAHVMRLGRGWDGRTGAQGSWAAESGYRTIAHEFGHYGLHLRDEYFGYAGGAEVPATCTDAATRSLAGPGAAASVMDDQYRTSELSARGVAGLWSDSCLQTAQWQLNGESAWETLARRYADRSPAARWRLATPAGRGGALAGPDGLPQALMALPEVTVSDSVSAAGRRTLTVVGGPGAQPVRGAIVALQKPDGRVIGQGLTDTAGVLVVYGAEPGDLLRATSFDGGLHGRLSVGAGEAMALTLTPVAGSLAQSGGPNPHMLAVAQPAAGGQVELLVALQHFGAGADPRLGVNAPGSLVGSTPLLSYSPADGAYTGSYAFAATERGTGQLWADRRVGGERPTLQASYRLQRVQGDRPQEVFSDDGHLSLQLTAGALPYAEAYVVVMPTGAAPGAPPAGLAMVGEAYAVTASGAVAELEKPGALSLSYDGALVSGAAPAGLAIYRWDPAGAAWRAVPGAVDGERRAVAAVVAPLGVYALMAPAGDWAEPQRKVWLPVLRR